MFVVLKKRSVIIIAAALAVCAVVSAALGAIGTSTDATLATRLIPIYSVERDDGKVALTFDAAWGSDKTRAIMDELEKAGYKGTFFLTGFWIDANVELVKEIYDRGHQIANHSENHKHMSKLDKESVQSEIDGVSAKIESITGEKPSYFRAPFGEYDNALINTLTERSTVCVQWSIDSLDWKGLSGGEITDRVVSRLGSGDIVLFHNNSDHILDALPVILLALKNKGLTAVRVDELIYKENYTINSQGTQIKNS